MGDSYYVDCSIKGKLYRLAFSTPYNINRIVEISDFAVVFTYGSNGEEKILRVKHCRNGIPQHISSAREFVESLGYSY